MHLSEMLSWPHWSAPARHFLHQHQPELPLFKAMHDYLQMLRMFQQRTVRHFRQAFAEVLACAPPQPVMISLM